MYLHLRSGLRAALICAVHNQSRKRLMIKLFCPLFWISGISPLGDGKQLRGVTDTGTGVMSTRNNVALCRKRKKTNNASRG